MQDCFNCAKYNDKMNKCAVFTNEGMEYIWNRYDKCFAWTDDKEWEKKLKKDTAEYIKQKLVNTLGIDTSKMSSIVFLNSIISSIMSELECLS